MSLYLTARHIADKIPGAKAYGKGFKAPCPAHPDPSPSLSIDDGIKGTLVYCHAGCSQKSILDAIGVPRAALFKDYRGNGAFSRRGDMELRDFLKANRPPERAELMPVRTLEDVLRIVLDPQPQVWAEVGLRWDDMLSRPFVEQMATSRHVVINAICADLMVDEIDNGYEYTPDEQRRLEFKLWETFDLNGGQR